MTQISPKDQKALLEEFGEIASRIIVKMTPIIKKTYASEINLINLLMALPIKFEFKEYDYSKIEPSDGRQKPSMEAFAVGGYITRDTKAGNPNRLVVFLTFNKDISQTWEEYFAEFVDSETLLTHAAFTYLHEAMHILNRHYDYYLNQKYFTIAKNANSDLSDQEIDQILNHGFDYWINAYLIEQAKINSIIYNFRKLDDTFANLYDPNLSPKMLSQQEIIRKLAKEAKIDRQKIPGLGELVSISINGNESKTLYLDEQHLSDNTEVSGQMEQEIGDVLDSARAQLLDKSRGTGSTGGFKDLGVSYEVPIDWFGALKASVFGVVQKLTTNSDQTWGKLKTKFRHVSPMPGRIYYDNKVAAVISIDQSGSMSDDDLTKINYVVEELAKKSVFIELLIHDTAVVKQERFVKPTHDLISNIVKTRVAFGGTSHKEVFDKIREISEEIQGTKIIYLSFSDNWSDIEHHYDDELFKKVIPYWITTDENKLLDVPGMQISLENGLLTK